MALRCSEFITVIKQFKKQLNSCVTMSESVEYCVAAPKKIPCTEASWRMGGAWKGRAVAVCELRHRVWRIQQSDSVHSESGQLVTRKSFWQRQHAYVFSAVVHELGSELSHKAKRTRTKFSFVVWKVPDLTFQFNFPLESYSLLVFRVECFCNHSDQYETVLRTSAEYP